MTCTMLHIVWSFYSFGNVWFNNTNGTNFSSETASYIWCVSQPKVEYAYYMKDYIFFNFTVKKNDNVKLMGPITYEMKYIIYHLLQLA
jgi:hypothetical protein